MPARHSPLVRIGGRAAPALVDALSKTNDRSRKEDIGEALQRIGSSAIPALMAGVVPDGPAVISSAWALGQLAHPAALAKLMEASKFPGPYARWAAVEALGRIGDPGATGSLIARLADANVLVQASAITALGAAGDASALAPLRSALAQEQRPIRQKDLATAIAQIERRMRGESAVPEAPRLARALATRHRTGPIDHCLTILERDGRYILDGPMASSTESLLDRYRQRVAAEEEYAAQNGTAALVDSLIQECGDTVASFRLVSLGRTFVIITDTDVSRVIGIVNDAGPEALEPRGN